MPGIGWERAVERAQTAKFGADISLIGSYVRMITNGMKIGEYRPDDSSEEIDIVVRLPVQYRTVGQLDDIRIQTTAGLVPIANFVDRVPKARKSTRLNSSHQCAARMPSFPCKKTVICLKKTHHNTT